MSSLKIQKVEERPGAMLLYNVRMESGAGKIEFPVTVETQGSPALTEAAVFRSARDLVENLIGALWPHAEKSSSEDAS